MLLFVALLIDRFIFKTKRYEMLHNALKTSGFLP
ncbi:hypothetical protein PSEUDO8BK_10388 [Pseudomonas sp. 8BK]|nr:hypothetical protein PSEUDO8BK_10388 [Pseudomonas sp. 8BK]